LCCVDLASVYEAVLGWYSVLFDRARCNLRQIKILLLWHERRISAWRRYAIDPTAPVIGSVFDHAELADLPHSVGSPEQEKLRWLLAP
jgi:hypothetical protein